ncbi:MAG: GAF and ANTAR domain-containing protein [Nocardioidaceae bacterium]|nr:GAF and ANTAR domain-containing protein [Nocardioidaceae bacterium]
MADDRTAWAHAQIRRQPRRQPGTETIADYLHRLCSATASSLPISGVGLNLMTESGGGGMAGASDSTSEQLEELQFTLGEGPCIEAFVRGQPVLEPDLEAPRATRWPMYSTSVLELGVRAVFAFPLQVGAERLGVLDLYRDQIGSLSAEQTAQAIAFAGIAVTSLLDHQQGNPPGEGAADLDDPLEYRFELYQAQGMVAVQLRVGVAEALARLRAYAYATNRRLSDVAGDVVERRLDLADDA